MEKDKNPMNDETDPEHRVRSRNIGAKLRQLYDDVTQENVPDEFLRILEEAQQNRQSTDEN